jgi:mannose/fructose/N-acetylgalactosamine-specific phosphotransferase system component IIC
LPGSRFSKKVCLPIAAEPKNGTSKTKRNGGSNFKATLLKIRVNKKMIMAITITIVDSKCNSFRLHIWQSGKLNFYAASLSCFFYYIALFSFLFCFSALDIVLYSAHFAGMKLAGIILIAVGFFLVMLPENWPDYITRLLR